MQHERRPDRQTIGVAVIGTGSVARAHIEALRALPSVAWPSPVEPRLQVLCSRQAGRAAEGAERWSFARWTTDWRNAIEDRDVGLVIVTTPNDLHAGPAVAALAAGKHVLCEKPLARTADEARGMVKAAQRSGRVHATGFNYRSAPALHLARSLIVEGRLGAIYHVRRLSEGVGHGRDLADPLAPPP